MSISAEQVDKLISVGERFVEAFERMADALEASTATQARIAEQSIQTMKATTDILNHEKTPY